MANKSKPKFPGKLNVNQIDNTYVKPSIVKELQNKSVVSKTTMPIVNRFSNKVNTNKIDNTYVAPSVTKDLTVKTKTSNSTVPVFNWTANKNKNAVAEAVAKRKPVKKEEDNDSWVENMGEIVDPTGISSYDDVYRAYKNTGLSKETGIEVLGALPLIGKIAKIGKGVQQFGKGLGLTSRQAKSLKNARIGSELIANSGRVSDAVQAALGSKDDSGFTYNPNDDNTLKYNGRNIFPDSGASENMYANGGEIQYPGPVKVKNYRDFNYKYGKNYNEKQFFGKQPLSAEQKLDNYLGSPLAKAHVAATDYSHPEEDERDNLRHSLAGRYVTEAIANKTGNIPFISKGLGVLGANVLGAAHELDNFQGDRRDWKTKLRESGEDMFNNFAGSMVGGSPLNTTQKNKASMNLANKALPDGYGEVDPFRKGLTNNYTLPKHAGGGRVPIVVNNPNDPRLRAYTETQIQEAMKNKGLPKKSLGGRVLPRFAEAGTVDTGAGITDYAGYAQMAMPIAHMLMPDQQVKDTRGNVVGNKMDTGYAMGSKALDWGTKGLTLSGGNPFIGAAAGVAGAIVGGFENESNNKKIDKQKLLDNDNIYNEDTGKAFNTNTGNFTQRRSTNTNMSFAAGGQVIDEDMGNPNAELELNETFRDPMTGETGMVDGPSHDEGGIEMSLAEGTQIWSDRLKHNGRTFASLTKPIINKIANIEKGLDTNPNSRFKQNSIKLLNAQLDFFFNIQESDKQQDEMKRTLKKQEGGVVDDMGNYHYANGGIYIKPENRNKMAMGGMMKYDEGGPVIGSINPSTGRAYTMQDIFAYNQGEDLRPHVPGQLSGDTYTGGNINLGQTTRNFALNNSSGEYGPLNNQSFTQSINKKSANIPETIQGRQLPNYSLQSPTLNAYTTPETVAPNATYARKPNGINYNNPEYVDPNFQMLGTTGRTNLPTTGAGPGGVNPALFNKANYSSGDYYMNHPTPKGGSSADVTAAYEKQRSNDAADQANMTAEEKSAALRNRIDAFRKRGKIGQGVTAAVSNLTQADRLRSLAAPNKISNVNYLSSMTGPDLVNYGNQRNTIEQGASAVVDKAGKYLGNSGSIMATANAANLQKQQQLGESYQGQENANAAIMNQSLAQKNQAAIAQAERNSAIQQENYANKYGYDAMLASGLNANDAITASQMGQMFGNDVTFGNDLERARILGNKYAGKVWNSTDDNTIAANNSQLVESRFGGTIGKYADGGNVYNTKLNAVLNEQSNKNAALMDAEYQQNLNAGNKAFTSKVTGLDYKVLPRSEKDLYAANMWKETHKTAPTKSQVTATKKAIENKPTSSVKAKEVARSIETWNTQGMTSNNVPKAQVPTATPDFGNQSTMQYMDQNNMPTFNNPNVEPTRNEIARMMKNVPTYKPGTYKQQATPLFESVPTDKRSKYTPATADSPDYGNQNTMQYMNQNNMPTNFGPPKLVNNPNTKTIKMNEGLNQNNVDNTRTNLQANKSPKKQDQNIPMLNQKIGKPTIMNQGSDAYNDIRDYAKANETGTTSTKKENTRSINTSKTNILTDAKSAINKYDINSMKRDQSAMVSKAAESALHNIANGFKKPVPTSLRVEIKDILNNQLGTNFKVTEDDFTDSQKAKILELVNKKDSMNKVNPRKYIKAINTYKDYDLIDNENMNDINSLWGDAKNVRNTLGEFNYKQKGDTTYIDDIWNLNEKENGKVKKSPIEWYNYWTNKGYEIGPAIPRAAGSAWGSAGSAKGDDSKGTKMNIKLYNPKNKSKNKS